MNQNKIKPCLWFNTKSGNISIVIEYYKHIFKEHFQNEEIMTLGETPSGNTEMCEVYIFEQNYNFMSTANYHHSFNDALSFALNCEDQKEIDKYWNYFTLEGEESQCGWCTDKFGLKWQVIPKNLGTLMSMANSFEVMMKQKKIIIEEYLK